MARIRTIKPEFPQSESMGRVSRDARLCFVQMWTLADDEGRLRGNSRMLASLLFPYDDDAPDLIDGWLDELDAEDCILRFTADGSTYIQIAKWLSHQKIDKPSTSKIPAFDESSRIFSKARERSGLDQGSRIKDQGRDQGEDRVTAASPPAPAPAPAASRAIEPPPKTGQVWDAYSTAYFERYGAVPVRNAKVNGQLSKFIDRIGTLEAPSVAAFYVRHCGQFYVRGMHSVDAMLNDAEKLRTEWATGNRMTATKAQQVDRTATNGDAFAALIAEAEAKERANG
jgi:hypothetical protein